MRMFRMTEHPLARFSDGAVHRNLGATDEATRSWWCEFSNREGFNAAVQDEQARMQRSKVGSRLSPPDIDTFDEHYHPTPDPARVDRLECDE